MLLGICAVRIHPIRIGRAYPGPGLRLTLLLTCSTAVFLLLLACYTTCILLLLLFVLERLGALRRRIGAGFYSVPYVLASESTRPSSS